MFSSSGINRYVSMRVHGTSAHLRHSTLDVPEKCFEIVPGHGGAIVQSNFGGNFDIFLSIPSPLLVERRFSILTFISRLFGRRDDVEQVFGKARLRVVRVEIMLGRQVGATLGSITLMDGNKKLSSAPVSSLPLQPANTDPYYDGASYTYSYEVNHPVTTALGVSLSGGFSRVGACDANQLEIVAARAVFVFSE